MEIRRFAPADAKETAALVAETLRISNSRDYSADYIEETIRSHSAEVLTARAKDSHMYVVTEDDRIIGCGAIAGFWGSETESILLTIFVLPSHQGKGIGRRIIEALERDPYFLRAERCEIPASVTACEFYKKMGYTYKNGVTEPDEEGIIRLEKYREQ